MPDGKTIIKKVNWVEKHLWVNTHSLSLSLSLSPALVGCQVVIVWNARVLIHTAHTILQPGQTPKIEITYDEQNEFLLAVYIQMEKSGRANPEKVKSQFLAELESYGNNNTFFVYLH